MSLHLGVLICFCVWLSDYYLYFYYVIKLPQKSPFASWRFYYQLYGSLGPLSEASGIHSVSCSFSNVLLWLELWKFLVFLFKWTQKQDTEQQPNWVYCEKIGSRWVWGGERWSGSGRRNGCGGQKLLRRLEGCSGAEELAWLRNPT